MWYSLKLKRPIFVAKERDCIRHHPDVAAATVEVGHAPVAVVVADADDAVVLHGHEGGVVVPPLQHSWRHTTP